MVVFESKNQMLSERGKYCAILWKDTIDIGVVPISSIRKLPSHIRLYEWCAVVNDGQRREGQIIFKGQSDISLYINILIYIYDTFRFQNRL